MRRAIVEDRIALSHVSTASRADRGSPERSSATARRKRSSSTSTISRARFGSSSSVSSVRCLVQSWGAATVNGLSTACRSRVAASRSPSRPERRNRRGSEASEEGVGVGVDDPGLHRLQVGFACLVVQLADVPGRLGVDEAFPRLLVEDEEVLRASRAAPSAGGPVAPPRRTGPSPRRTDSPGRSASPRRSGGRSRSGGGSRRRVA